MSEIQEIQESRMGMNQEPQSVRMSEIPEIQVVDSAESRLMSEIQEPQSTTRARYSDREPTRARYSDGEPTRYIFKIDQLNMKNSKYYMPEIVSVGPCHHGEEKLQAGENIKLCFQNSLFDLVRRETEIHDYHQHCVSMIQEEEQRIRNSYQQVDLPPQQELLNIMVVDGCFLLEFFLVVACIVDPKPLVDKVSMPLIFEALKRDVIKVGNQIPFFILEIIFEQLDLAKKFSCSFNQNRNSYEYSLLGLLKCFFARSFKNPKAPYTLFRRHMMDDIVLSRSRLHLLDYLCESFVPYEKRMLFLRQLEEEPRYRRYQSESESDTGNAPPQENIPCASTLREKGVKIKAGDFLLLSSIKFAKGVLSIPRFVIDEFLSTAILNCIAFEQCYTTIHEKEVSYVTGFAAVLDSLVDTAEDVRLLRENRVIEHFYGTDQEVAQFINNLGRDFSLLPGMDKMWGLFAEINTHCRDSRTAFWVSFKKTYFGTPWIFFSALAAVVLLLLTIAQTIFSALSYLRPSSK